MDIEVDVDMHRYFSCLKGLSKSVQVLLNAICRNSYGTDSNTSEIPGPVLGKDLLGIFYVICDLLHRLI